MANIKSAIKRARKADEAHTKNTSIKTGFRTQVRRFNELLEQDPSEAEKYFPEVCSALDKAAQKGVIHRNTAARKKARLSHNLSRRLKEA